MNENTTMKGRPSYFFSTIAIILVTCVFSLLTFSHLVRDLDGLLWNFSLLLTNTIGLTFIVITGGFDVSFGAQTALSIAAIIRLYAAGVPAVAAFACGIAVCLLCGTMNAVLNYIPHISQWLITISTLLIFYGLAFLVSGGDEPLSASGLCNGLRTSPLVIPLELILALLGLLCLQVVLHFSYYGKYLKALASNSDALQMIGISPNRIRFLSYLFASLFFALQAILRLSRIESFSPSSTIGSECLAFCTTLLSNGIIFPVGKIHKYHLSRVVSILISVTVVSIWYTGALSLAWNPSVRIILLGVMLAVSALIDSRQYRTRMIHERIRASGANIS